MHGPFPSKYSAESTVGHRTVTATRPGTDGTVIEDSRDPSRNDNSYNVVRDGATDDTAVMDGLIITAGNAAGTTFGQQMGGGMFNHSGSPTVVCWSSDPCAISLRRLGGV